ncbi:MAG: DUF2235 domain-containing protein [Kiritimatiellales bacterium]
MATRNLVLLFDGTWNKATENGDDNQTNVEKLYHFLPKNYKYNVHYEEGVGTKSNEKILGGTFGAGIDERISGAYRFLQRRYAEDTDNKLFIFGFSRGAYTARTFAQLLYYCGMPRKEQNMKNAWKSYYKQDSEAANKLKKSDNFFDVEIEMLGVWDTVKSTKDPDRKDTVLYPNVKAAYHAIAIDEKRKNFPILHFDTDSRVTQTWFSGVHSDIGGGYPDEESQLSNITLSWMIDAAKKHGLEFIENINDRLALDTDGTSKMHDSYCGNWRVLGKHIRQINPNDHVHSSVRTRILNNASYRPLNLPDNPLYI